MASMADSNKLNQLIEDAPALDHMQRSLVETVLDYADSDDRQGVATYLESMSAEGLGRFVKLLTMITPLAKSKLLQK